MKQFFLALALLFALMVPVCAVADERGWDDPHEPYNVMGNIWYVGTRGIGVYLITTPQGHILIDGATEKGAKVVEANIVSLGFKLKDIKYIVETHAHWDHVGGLARLKADTGAIFVASAGDRYGLEHGVHVGDNVYGGGSFSAIAVDREIGEGGMLALGGVVLTAHMTPGHTRGCTSWTMLVDDKGVSRSVIFFGSTSIADNVLVGNKAYPGIGDDYRLSFKRLKAIKADVFLVNHPELADMDVKRAAQVAGKPDAFVDPRALPAFIKESEADFNTELAKARRKATGRKGTVQ